MLNLKISIKLPIVIVSLAVLALGITAYFAMSQSEAALEAAQSEKLEAVQESRIAQMSSYLLSIQEDVQTLAANHMVIDGIKDLEDTFSLLGSNPTATAQRLYIADNANAAGEKHKLDYARDGSSYSMMHKKYHPWFRQVMEARGYYDIFLINEFGDESIDHLLVEKIDETTVLLESGCVCCSVRSDLVEAMRGLIAKRADGRIPPFERLVIETTGLADPAPIVHTLMSDPIIAGQFRLDGLVATVDGVLGFTTLDNHDEAV